METILKVKNLTVELRKERIIEDLSFEVKKGEVLTIVGPNGAGKSVLLKALLGIIPSQGEIVFSKEARIGYLPQGLSQLSFLNLPLTLKEFFNFKEKSKEKILEFLEKFDLKENILNKQMAELSFGQFQRALMAWVLISRPNILLFDEPSTGIDIKAEEKIYSLLKDLKEKEGLSLLLVSHDLNIVYNFSDNVLCLSKRGFRCYGKPKEALSPSALTKLYGGKVKFYQHSH